HPPHNSEIPLTGRAGRAGPLSCESPLREDANVDPFSQVDQAFDRVPAQPIPPPFSHAVSDEDLRDAGFPSKANNRSREDTMAFEDLNRAARLAGDGKVLFECCLIFWR